MRKPTAFEFFSLEVLVWILLLVLAGVYNDWTPRNAMTVFLLKVSVINVSVAAFNMIMACISMATHWWPWEDRQRS